MEQISITLLALAMLSALLIVARMLDHILGRGAGNQRKVNKRKGGKNRRR